MAGKPKPDWDKSRPAPDYRTDNSKTLYPSEATLPDYGPSTNASQAGASRRMAAQVAKQRNKRSLRNGRWFEGNQLIGVASGEFEDSPIHRVKPRSLKQRGLS